LGPFIDGFDIFAILETWFTADKCYEMENFKAFHFIRHMVDANARRGSGGISIYVKKDLQPYINVVQNYRDCIVWLEVNQIVVNGAKPQALGFVYFPPEGSTYHCKIDDLFVRLERDIAKLSESHNLIQCQNWLVR
jgi:hypothetical protein